MTAVLIAGLWLATFLERGLGPALPHMPDVLIRRTTGLAPALLAALVVTQLVGGGLRLEARDAAVAAALGLAAVRAPLLVSVVAGAAVAAVLRLLLHVS